VDEKVTVYLEQLEGEQFVARPIELTPDIDIQIDENNLDAEMCRAGQLLVYYGDLSAELKAQSARKKDYKEAIYSQLAQLTRSEAEKESRKVTEGVVKEKVLTNPDYINTQQEHNVAEMFAQKVDNFFRAQQKRVDLLIALAYKQRAEIQKGGL
jgi:hypothetical protein